MQAKRLLPLAMAAVAMLAACGEEPSTPVSMAQAPRASAAAGSLLWFGYAAGAEDEPSLIGTDSYANWGEVITDGNAASTLATQPINALSAHNMKAVVELGQLLWAGPGYTELYPDYVARWNSWKAANASALTSAGVIAFIIRDEPFSNGTNIASYQTAAAMVKQSFPWAKIILIEAAQTILCTDPGCSTWSQAGQVSSVDWIGVDRYAIDPRTDVTFRDAVTRMKQQFPGRKMVYVADGYWDASHGDAFGPDWMMRDVMTWWYDVARADPDAVMIATFIWNPLDGATSSRDFSPWTLAEHTRVGREITGRGITHLYPATGTFTIGSDGYATGWACDPDGAWGEAVTVKVYKDGVYASGGTAGGVDGLGPWAACRSGSRFHGYHVPLTIGMIGHRMTATVVDLDGNEVALPTTCKDAPACVWYPDSYRPKGAASLSSTGLVTGWACDRDAPTVSIQVQIAAGGTVVGKYTANVASEAAVNTQCGGGTAHRFSVQLATWTKGQVIHVSALDTMEGSTYLGPTQTW
jgi:hypothetical protein